MRRVTILGATGSIGRQALAVLRRFPERFQLEGLSIHRQVEALPELLAYKPKWVAVTHPEAYYLVRSQNGALGGLPLLSAEELYAILEADPGDVVLNAIVGAGGFWASWHTLRGPANLALANKESLVFGGFWLAPYRERILPVDSEHSALFQCLQGEGKGAVARLYLTASGGPFRGRGRADLVHVTVQEALRHPVWAMGQRITIDSATLMNKALELIEAYWLFEVPEAAIEVWIHPECIVHSLVEFRDGSVKAQLSLPDMQLPILYALSYPERLAWPSAPYRLNQLTTLHFEPVDEETFPSIRFARQALRKGLAAPALLNAADEVIVERFLAGRLRFLDIFTWLEWSLSQAEMDLSPQSPQALLMLEAGFRQKLAEALLEAKA